MNILILTADHAYSFIIQAEALAAGFKKRRVSCTLSFCRDQESTRKALAEGKPSHVICVCNWTDYETIIKPSIDAGFKTYPWIVNDDYKTFRPILELNSLPFIVTPSNHCKRNFVRNGIEEKRIFVIPEAVNPKKWYPMSRRELSPFLTLVSTPNPDCGLTKYDLVELRKKKIPIIYTTGGDATKKGAQEVMRALATLDKSIPWIYIIKTWAYPLVFEKSIEELKLAQDLGIFDRVRYIAGDFSEVFMRSLTNICDIYAAPSRHEGFGLPHVEAQMCGKPAVGMKNTATAETIIDDHTGFLADVDPQGAADEPQADIKSLAEGLKRLLTDVSYREQLGKNAYYSARERFSPEVVADQFLKLFRVQIFPNTQDLPVSQQARSILESLQQ